MAKAQSDRPADDNAFDAMIERIPDIGLFVSFVELDGSTEGKTPSRSAG